MKKYLCVLISVFLMLSIFTSCQKEESNTDETTEAEASADDTQAELTSETDGDMNKRTYKTVSFFGDSITTYEGYSNNAAVNGTTKDNRVWQYSEGNVPLESTWWYKAMQELSLDLCVNNAYSGDKVSSDIVMTRAENLHTDAGIYPDIIIIYIGINDYNGNGSAEQFKEDYDKVLGRIRETYGESEIFCCTLLPCHSTTKQRLERLNQFNGAIKDSCDKYSAHIIDLYGTCGNDFGNKLSLYTIDNLHPNILGMDLMAKNIVKEVSDLING